MEKLAEFIEGLKKSNVKKMVDERIIEFKELGRQSSEELFKELCFCIMTANCGAEACIRIQKALGNELIYLPEKQLSERLKRLGYRFPNIRAKYIVEARKHKDELRKAIESLSEPELREWLVKHVKGLGYKEASHFLRNIGFENVAIIDFHIVDILSEYKLIEKPKHNTLNKKMYLKTEKVLRKLGEKVGLNLAELDLYLWFAETEKVLK